MKTIHLLGFISAIIGWLGFLLNPYLLYLFPVSLICGVLLVFRSTNNRDRISGISLIIVSIILIFGIIKRFL